VAFLPKAFDRLKGALRKTAQILNTDVRTLFVPGRQINEDFLTEVEEKLLAADVGVANAEKIVTTMRDRWRLGKIKNADQCIGIIREEMLSGWGALSRELRFGPTGHPTVILVAGVNGAGKTTSIAKLSWYLKNQLGKKVMVAAADTFRAGAVHQLTIWADRLGVEIVKHKQNADPAAVAYDACEAAKTRGIDVLIVDTAGRLPTQENLIRELVKIRDVVAKRIEGAPHESLLVLDATTGQNAINQAKVFGNAINTTGIILAKLDGTAKGGVILSIRDQLNLPVKFIGLGETPEDIAAFNPEDYVTALLGDRPA
jgi:fused signal recognition particle receptor